MIQRSPQKEGLEVDGREECRRDNEDGERPSTISLLNQVTLSRSGSQGTVFVSLFFRNGKPNAASNHSTAGSHLADLYGLRVELFKPSEVTKESGLVVSDWT